MTIYGLGPADDYSSLFAEIDPKVARDNAAAERATRTLSDAAGVPVTIAEGSPTIDSAPAPGAGSTSPTPKAATYLWSAHLDAQTVRPLSADGVTFKPSASQMARIAAEDAVTAAADGLSFLNSDNGRVDSAVLGYLTDATSGTEKSGDPAVKSEVVPRIANHLVWFVTFEGFTAPVLGGNLDGVSHEWPAEWARGKSRMWVAINPDTGEFLGARSIVMDPRARP